jgi:CheY-like chemotaxis protein/two-component sensor histidine kinase
MKTFSDLLEQLLNISKFDAGLIKPKLSSFNLAQLFNWLEHNFAQAALDKKLRLQFYWPMSRQLFLSTDIGLLKSVLMNLLSNAIKFTTHGGILVSARVHGGKVLLQVWDTGIGIPAENLSHIFDEFYQVHNPQRDRNRGLGLGLSIVKRSLTLLDSEIDCRSTVGKGTVFGFSLPLDNGAGRVTQQAATELALEGMFDDSFTRGKRFVLVEDDALVAHAMISWLEGMGGKVQFFLSAEDALKSDLIAQADCFIADYMLGGTLNGIQFLNRLLLKLGRPINGVLVTGDTSPTFVHAAAHCDWSVLYKPVSPSRLIAILREQEERKR